MNEKYDPAADAGLASDLMKGHPKVLWGNLVKATDKAPSPINFQQVGTLSSAQKTHFS